MMISILLPYHKPGGGSDGPLQSIIGVCDLLKEKYAIQIITEYTDVKNTAIEDSVKNHKIVTVQQFKYSTLLPILNSSEIVWINSVYSIPSSFIPLLTLLYSKRTTILISTRGQLLSGSINLKKRAYLQLYKLLLKVTQKPVYIHYSTEEEKKHSYSVFKSFKSLIFADPLKNTFLSTKLENSQSSSFIIGFLGRIASIKNIEFIINIMPHLPHHIIFHIYGVETEMVYKKKLDRLIVNQGLESRVFFKGPYVYNQLAEVYQQIDLAVIPSISESFCYSFFEAIENNTPVIGSNGLPWQGANDYVLNTILPLKPDIWVKNINEIILLSQESLEKRQFKLEEFYKFVLNTSIKNLSNSFRNLIYNR
ncbi:glycosyltransferase family 4 protein [Marixanthomonas sp. SCSIO 43207]|uniref:glycosyltransferase n=1 Tax=Marixanthomonas sp. SCSIO 43207 TaxID=2779360 RepID=UPI001CA8202D|nr:glycosyltransferase [Marixanthomonas sp. SCSIO 43207]UAB80421.1 glycosyltransferase family 4 protein [Marixanthomonas sp. SCSIO 43207]